MHLSVTRPSVLNSPPIREWMDSGERRNPFASIASNRMILLLIPIPRIRYFSPRFDRGIKSNQFPSHREEGTFSTIRDWYYAYGASSFTNTSYPTHDHLQILRLSTDPTHYRQIRLVPGEFLGQQLPTIPVGHSFSPEIYHSPVTNRHNLVTNRHNAPLTEKEAELFSLDRPIRIEGGWEENASGWGGRLFY